MDAIQGKHFSITDPLGVNTVIYQINKNPKEHVKESLSLTAERLDYTEELIRKKQQKDILHR